MKTDIKLITEVIGFLSDAAKFLKTAGGEGEALYKRALRILKKLRVKK